MAATAQQIRPPKTQAGTWASMFPNEQKTQQESLLFVKKLLAVAISNIAYLRAIFPEAAFGDRCLEDLNLKILKEDGSCPGASQVIKWIKGCFDALDKKYLRMMTIGLYVDPDDPETAIETYTFKFSYTENGGIDIYRNAEKMSGAHSSSEVKKATRRLLHTIIVLTQSLKSLPEKVMMTMKLLYYDEVTPADYEPPGFVAAEHDGFVFEKDSENIKIGDVATPWHMMKVRVKTDKSFLEDEIDDAGAEEEVASEHPAIPAPPLSQHADVEDSQYQPSPSLGEGRTAPCQVVPDHAEQAHEEEQMSPDVEAPTAANEASESTETQQDSVRCACGNAEDDGLMIVCELCKTWQHGVCFQIFEEKEAPSRHVCHLCADPKVEERKPTDPTLYGQTEVSVQATCLWRRSLHSCLGTKRISGTALAKTYKIDLPVANGLYRRLEKEGFVKTPAKGKSRSGGAVVQEKIAAGIKKYFTLRNKPGDEKDPEPKEDEKKEKEKEETAEPMDAEIASLTSKAENLDVSGKWKGGKTEEQEGGQNNKNQEMEGRQNRRKRSKPEVFEFDDSQELSQSQSVGGEKKKRKRSRVNHPIEV